MVVVVVVVVVGGAGAGSGGGGGGGAELGYSGNLETAQGSNDEPPSPSSRCVLPAPKCYPLQVLDESLLPEPSYS